MAIFRKTPTAVPADGVSFGGANPYGTSLAPSNSIQPVTGVVGAFGIPSSFGAWQQPVPPPPSPRPGVKSILPQVGTVAQPSRKLVRFSPANNAKGLAPL